MTNEIPEKLPSWARTLLALKDEVRTQRAGEQL
jgi:hypothetical protein